MRFISTRGNAPAVTASEAILQGLAPDGGLYVPEEFPQISMRTLAQASSYPELAYEVMAPFFIGDVLENQLAEICMEAFDFPVEMHWHSDREAVLELFWGPTAAFKDFGARFLAVCMERLLKLQSRKLTILVATSGDTGGAVAAAFHGREGISVRCFSQKVGFQHGRKSSLSVGAETLRPTQWMECSMIANAWLSRLSWMLRFRLTKGCPLQTA